MQKTSARYSRQKSDISKPLVAMEKHEIPANTLEEWVAHYWGEFAYVSHPNVFEQGGVSIATDGGMSDVGTKLLYPLQYFYAILSLAFVAANTFMITTADLMAILKVGHSPDSEKAMEEQFLLSKFVVQCVVGDWLPFVGDNIERMVPLLELLTLWGLILNGVRLAVLACLAPRLFKKGGKPWDMKRWLYTKELFWVVVPNLASFSAMRLLYYVTPTVIGTEAYVVGYLVHQALSVSGGLKSHLRSIFPIFMYLLKLAFCLCIGFDAFLVKFRMAEQYINNRGDDDVSLSCLSGAIIFLFQILGVVNLNWFVKLRLFIFIFGGEDGNFDTDEKARTDVWNALLARRIYQEHGPIKGTIVMLGFDDYDFQLLVLEETATARFRHEQLLLDDQRARGDVGCETPLDAFFD